MNPSTVPNFVTEVEFEMFCNQARLIADKEPDFFRAFSRTTEHLAQTYSDKYQASAIDTKPLLYHETLGLGATMHNAAKYIQRYITTGFGKSGNVVDLRKCIHYVLFELTRQIKLEGKAQAERV